MAEDALKIGLTGALTGPVAGTYAPAVEGLRPGRHQAFVQPRAGDLAIGSAVLEVTSAGGSPVVVRLAGTSPRQVLESPLYFGLHLMGGSRMGVDPATSVVEPDYRLRGFDNIYVCDSSLYPNAPGINPALTVMALAQRLSEELTR